MPITLHPHLKRGLQYELHDAEPFEEDADSSGTYLTTGERSEKRRRVELIATQYLKGNVPVILSARLKGPFGEDWKNPWAKKKRRAKQNSHTKARDAQHEHEDVGDDASSQPSPEVSRTTQTVLDYHTQSTERWSHTIASRTAPRPQRHERSDEREYSIANIEPDVTVQELGSASAWLKRPANSRARRGSYRDPYHHPSPTPTRHGNVPIDRYGRVQLAPPKGSMDRVSSFKSRPPVPEPGWSSSASAPMDISTPVKPSSIAKNRRLLTASKPAQKNSSPTAESPRDRPTVVSEDDVTECQIIALYGPPSSHDAGQHSPNQATEIDRGSQMTKSINRITVRSGSNVKSSTKRPSREEVRRSAERCIPEPTTSNSVLNKLSRESKTFHSLLPCGPKLVASPAPNSSIGFTYQKVQKATGKVQTKKAKPVDIQTSPEANVNGDAMLPRLIQADVAVSKDDEPQSHEEGKTSKVMPPPRLDVYDIEAIEQEHNNTAISRQSVHSTQTAMLLAQMEFQEGSFLSPGSDDARNLPVQQENGTPRGSTDEPINVSITPFHAFNSELDKSWPTDNVTAEVPISTQDLFNAASPYTFSTVKKKTARPARSSLRFAIHPSPPRDEDGHANTDHSKSPSSSRDRIPLKERNSKVSVGNTVTGSEKGSQDAAGSPKLGHLLDDLDLNASLSFTSNFMRDINGIT